MRMGLSFVIFFISLAHAHARPGLEAMFMDDSICDTCLDITREAKRTLNDPKLFEKVSLLSGEVCELLPYSLEEKCLESSEAYLHQTKTSLEELFHEKNLCNRTGLCSEKTRSQPKNGLLLPEEVNSKCSIDKDCVTCRRAIKDLLSKLKQPVIKSKITKVLLEYCEEGEESEDHENEEQCKQMIRNYGSMLLSKLVKLKASNLCIMLGFCDQQES